MHFCILMVYLKIDYSSSQPKDKHGKGGKPQYGWGVASESESPGVSTLTTWDVRQ